VLGVGVGYVPQEYAALGIEFRQRGRRMDENIDALRQLWCEPRPQMNGETVRFDGVDAQPRPLQRPCPPIVVGGDSEPALRRAVERANGWYGVHKDVPSTRLLMQNLRHQAEALERCPSLGKLEISITPPANIAPTRENIEAYAALGVDRLVFWPVAQIDQLDEQRRYIERAVPLLEEFRVPGQLR
jgi:alkanesulfonate monooxygenase SsuD/methylene tetrahydromethanopterin reductase-like flavin-dependent oxidoreductase (luciferase family)